MSTKPQPGNNDAELDRVLAEIGDIRGVVLNDAHPIRPVSTPPDGPALPPAPESSPEKQE